jgi:hypothetical protein
MMTKSTIRKVGSLFFLGIFLWFYSVKDIHDVIHAGNVHSHYQNAHNFQTPGHHCLICDFEFPGFDDQTSKIELQSISFFIKVQNTLLPGTVSCEPVSLFSSRAPPAVA